MCELCEANVANFNQHMKKSHPGCGRSANRQGYRSNGSYVDGWFGGECGSGNPYYLLCGGCREKYLAIKSKAKVPIVERYAHLRQSVGLRNPELLPQFECDCQTTDRFTLWTTVTRERSNSFCHRHSKFPIWLTKY